MNTNPPTLDRRTKRRRDVRPARVSEIAALAGHGELAARAQELLCLPPLTLEVDGERCTVDRGTVRAGAVPTAIHAVLGPAALGDLLAGLQTTTGLLVRGDVQLSAGAGPDLAAWDHVLRALVDGVPLHEPGTRSFTACDGSPLDLHRTFGPGDDDAEIADFVAEAGYAHLRGWVDPRALPAIEREVDAAARASTPDAPFRWWSQMHDGSQRCTRVMYVLDASPTMRALVEGAVYERLGRLFGDGHRRFPDRPQSSEALIKPVGVARGLADLPWHRDCSQGGHDFGCAGYAIGLPLSATGGDAGYLRVVAGSHRASMPPPGTVTSYDAALPTLEIATEPGDLTIHVSCTLHGTVPPASRDRTVVYTTFSLPTDEDDSAREARSGMPDLARVDATR
jgi:hypothetical protein